MSTTGHGTEFINVQGLKASLKKGGNKGIFNEATCSTAAGTAAKEIATAPKSFSLVSGAKILVTFTNAITVANATLQVGSATAKPIYYHGAALAANLVKAGSVLLLVYDGTKYNIVGDLDTDTDTVTDITFDSNTNTLKKTVGGQQSDVVQIVTSGFSLTHDNATGADKFTAIGTATFTHDNTTGADKFTF